MNYRSHRLHPKTSKATSNNR